MSSLDLSAIEDVEYKQMAWVEKQYSKGLINRAGEALISLAADDAARDDAIAVVDNWRACHAYPLQAVKMTLLQRAKKVNNKALIAQRLKRRPSIEIKLRDNPNMKLSQMQDVGGCRAVLSNVKEVKQLANQYRKALAKQGKEEARKRPYWDGKEDFDYIGHPKPDGYRSIHLIIRYQTESAVKKIYNGQRIEVQIRTKLQHAWATAVETAQLFTGQALKTKIKNANEDWLRFFSLASAAFALREGTAPVPGTPTDRVELVRELKEIVERRNIITSLESWNNVVHHITEKGEPNAYQFLMVLDPTRGSLMVWEFLKDQMVEAQALYKEKEKEFENDSRVQVVLVSVESVRTLPKAYPNYYADTKEFVAHIQRELAPPPLKKTS